MQQSLFDGGEPAQIPDPRLVVGDYRDDGTPVHSSEVTQRREARLRYSQYQRCGGGYRILRTRRSSDHY